ncbi:2-C-methyl-D-erythritol 4-phosphate cytidylyltransferase [Desulfovirgula thermocuniculi]|uniref:2-C-methyl-D-erythritol 4-phosphate cytidylyltransferase n=1 Tax=Desulfovirgula thermocuniculi TaxID=348842 RepID=UPI0004029505
MGKVAAVIVAAGRAARMGGVNKQFLPLGGLPVLARSLLAFEAAPSVEECVVVAPPGETGRVAVLARGEWGCRKVVAVVPGGESRQESVLAGLLALSPRTGMVIVHDGARPLLEPELVEAVLAEANHWGAATLAVPVRDTVKEADGDGFVARTLPRERLWLAQTPQAFRFALLLEAHRRARELGLAATDDAALVEALGHPVRLVRGSYRNLKITFPEDYEAALALVGGVMPVRFGFGYDVHRLVAGRPLVLGGVTVPFPLGLEGHSDADVLLHAVMDALLGAAGLGDIGRHFPDTDPHYAGASSLWLLEQVGQMLSQKGFRVQNIDATLVAQAPRLAGYIPAMEHNIARALGVDAARVNVKATTTEGLGFAGRGEGMAAYAVAALGYREEASFNSSA